MKIAVARRGMREWAYKRENSKYTREYIVCTHTHQKCCEASSGLRKVLSKSAATRYEVGPYTKKKKKTTLSVPTK